ncbi:MAG: hypothetical protein PSY12_14220, partial [bacterium]|nr:hypothetical protein [bacterium]
HSWRRKWPGAGSSASNAGASSMALPFARWSGAYCGQWGTERAVFTGAGKVQSYAADEDDYLLIGRCTVERLGSY